MRIDSELGFSMCVIRCFYCIVMFAFPLTCFAEKVPCNADIITEYNIGISASVYVGVNISAKNTISEPVDGVSWVMYSSSGELLFNETWVGSNQRMHFNINPKLIGIVPIGSGDTTALTPIAIFNHMEFLIRDKQDSDGSEMREIFEERLSEVKEKYSDVSCQILGFVKKMEF